MPVHVCDIWCLHRESTKTQKAEVMHLYFFEAVLWKISSPKPLEVKLSMGDNSSIV